MVSLVDRFQVILDSEVESWEGEEKLELVSVIILTCSQVECLQLVGTSPVNFTQCDILKLFIHPFSNHMSIFSIRHF